MNKVRNNLINVLKKYFNDDYVLNVDCDIDELYSLACSLNIVGFLAYILKENNISNSKLENSLYKAVIRSEKHKKVKEEINQIFTDNNFEYLFLKGDRISRLYKQDYLRSSSDIDVIVLNNNFDYVCELLESKGFRCTRRSVHENNYMKDGVCIDLHRSFMCDNEYLEKMFTDYLYESNELNDNYNYLYLIAHGSKHILNGQLGLKFFIDLYHLRDLIDKEFVYDKLKMYQLDRFNDVVNSYLDKLVFDKKYDDLDYEIEDFIFSYASDEGSKNKALINSNDKKIKYVFNRLFPPYRIMKYNYPMVNKHKVLLPYYYFVRIITVFNSRRKYAMSEIRNSIVYSSDEYKKMDQFIRKIGLR